MRFVAKFSLCYGSCNIILKHPVFSKFDIHFPSHQLAFFKWPISTIIFPTHLNKGKVVEEVMETQAGSVPERQWEKWIEVGTVDFSLNPGTEPCTLCVRKILGNATGREEETLCMQEQLPNIGYYSILARFVSESEE
jgi:hypothetical protein